MVSRKWIYVTKTLNACSLTHVKSLKWLQDKIPCGFFLILQNLASLSGIPDSLKLWFYFYDYLLGSKQDSGSIEDGDQSQTVWTAMQSWQATREFTMCPQPVRAFDGEHPVY